MTVPGPTGVEPADGPAAAFGWTGILRLPDLWAPLLQPRTAVSFGLIAHAWHVSWTWESTDQARRTEVRAEASAALAALRRAFIEQEGRLINAYHCNGVVAGCALTERTEHKPRRRGFTRYLHVVVSGASPRLVEMEAEGKRLMAVANAVFGCRRSRALQDELVVASEVLYSAMTRVLRLAETRPDSDTYPHLERAAGIEMAAASRHIDTAVQREAGFTYFKGTLAGAAVALGLFILLGLASAEYWSAAIDTAGFVGAIVFGALGAIASVFQRLSADRMVLAFAPSRWRMLALGGLRPLVGATFGAVAHFALIGGVLASVTETAGRAAAFGLAAVTGFAAGFSERFATDMVKHVGRRVAGDPAPAPTEQTTAPSR